MDEHAILVFRDQSFTDEEQLGFWDNRATMHRARPLTTRRIGESCAA